MKHLFLIIKKLGFLIALAAVFLAADMILTAWAPVENSMLFDKNDYEKTVVSHGGMTEYDKVLFGNSVIISAYIEEASASGYVNFGLDYGKITDLLSMLDKGMLKPKSDLVIAMNYFVFMDDLETNPTYPWFRESYEPYLYFQRDRLSQTLKAGIRKVLTGAVMPLYTDLNKSVYYGVLPDEKLDEKIAVYKERYWGLDMTHYQDNLKALEALIGYCKEHGIRLRAIWMPWNGYIDYPENPAKVNEAVNAILSAENIAVLDLTDSYPRDCFHDLGHLEYSSGAPRFTKEIDEWLGS
jgi:hypothetical protein